MTIIWFHNYLSNTDIFVTTLALCLIYRISKNKAQPFIVIAALYSLACSRILEKAYW
jgi:hypothetical protein